MRYATIDDLPERYRKQLQPPTLEEIGKEHGLAPKVQKHKGPNKTEAEYGRRLELEFAACPVIFEAMTFHLSNGHSYTPDWVVYLPNKDILCVEVKSRGKNGFRLQSYQRAKVMFDQCKVELPSQFVWRWAEKSQGRWNENGR